MALPDEFLHALFPAGVLHPGQRDVGGELVVFFLEAQFDQPRLDGRLEPRHLLAAGLDAEPDDVDVRQRGEDAEPGELGAERGHVGGVDSRGERFPYIVDAVVGRVPEELQRDVGLRRVGQVQARHPLEGLLDGGHSLAESVEVDADEQAFAHTWGSGGRRLKPPAVRWVRGSPRRRPADVALNRLPGQRGGMTDREPDDPRDHEFSEGQGFDEPYEEFDLDPPELDVDPDMVDPVDSRVVTDMLDERNLPTEQVDAEELLDVALSYMSINRYEQAADTLERVASFAEDDLVAQEAWVNKGAAHAELEEFDMAIGAYKEALNIDDSSEHAATAETNLAYALWESGRSEQALEHAERAVEIDERFAEAWYNRGFFLLERGLAEDARNAFDNAIRLGYRNPGILEEKARALEELGEYDRAEEVAEEAEEIRKEAEAELVQE